MIERYLIECSSLGVFGESRDTSPRPCGGPGRRAAGGWVELSLIGQSI